MQNFFRAALVLGCFGLAGCASAPMFDRDNLADMTPAQVVQEPVRLTPPVMVVPVRQAEAVPMPAPVQKTAQVAPHEPNTIVVSTRERMLYYTDDAGVTRPYRIGVGRPGYTWGKTVQISAKKEWPDWTPPDEMVARQPWLPRYVSGGPGNPLGARALYLGSTLYRIHGTNNRASVGQAESSGCFRMMNADIIDLYNRVDIGTKVVVLP